MLCEQCRMREASIVIREVVNGTVTERNLCSECASQSDLGRNPYGFLKPFAKLLSGTLECSDSRRSERRTHLSVLSDLWDDIQRICSGRTLWLCGLLQYIRAFNK